MKVLIVSDTHRRNGNLQEVIERTAPFDMLIHLGDAEGSEDLITAWCMEQNQDCQVHMVLGNNDFFSCLDREKEIAIGPDVYKRQTNIGPRPLVSNSPVNCDKIDQYAYSAEGM